MTDMQAAPVQGTAPLSTSIDQGGAPLGTGGGAPNLSEPKVADTPKVDTKPESAGDTLKGEIARIKAEEAKETRTKAEDAANAAKAKVDEAKTDEKPVKAEDTKIAKAETEGDKPDVDAKADKGEPEKAATERAETDKRQSEGQKHHEPPARFLPKAKEVWGNVPHAVKGEIARLTQEHEAEVTKYREAGDRYEPIRQFDETARSNGRELKDSLAKVVEVEQALARNPIAGLEAVLREIGPRKADGSHLTLLEVAQHIVQNPQTYHQAVNQSRQEPQQQRQSDPEVAELKEQLQSMRQEQTVQSIIAPFADKNPRYYELEGDIAFFLTSGKIPASLTPHERLEAAYDMAVRINPTSSVIPSQAPEALAVAKPAPSDEAGSKSIRGAPNGQDPDDEDPDATDIRTLLRREMRKAS
jgi:hypothetical protein